MPLCAFLTYLGNHGQFASPLDSYLFILPHVAKRTCSCCFLLYIRKILSFPSTEGAEMFVQSFVIVPSLPLYHYLISNPKYTNILTFKNAFTDSTTGSTMNRNDSFPSLPPPQPSVNIIFVFRIQVCFCIFTIAYNRRQCVPSWFASRH